MWLSLPQRWDWSDEHSCEVSRDIWQLPCSWVYGTPHGHEVFPSCSRSSRATARSRWSLDQAECHVECFLVRSDHLRFSKRHPNICRMRVDIGPWRPVLSS